MHFNSKLIDFFKKHNLYDEKMFKYFSENCTMIDYRDDEQRVYIGTFYFIDKNKKLLKIHLNVPYIYDDKTMLISIHEFIHAILLYKKIDHKINLGLDREALPMLYEKIYINDVNSHELISYGKYLDSLICNEDEQYNIGLMIRDELLSIYNYNIYSMDKKAKKLVKKYKK